MVDVGQLDVVMVVDVAGFGAQGTFLSGSGCICDGGCFLIMSGYLILTEQGDVTVFRGCF